MNTSTIIGNNIGFGQHSLIGKLAMGIRNMSLYTIGKINGNNRCFELGFYDDSFVLCKKKICGVGKFCLEISIHHD